MKEENFDVVYLKLFLLDLVLAFTLGICLGRSFASKLEQHASSSPSKQTLCSGHLCGGG